MAGMARQHRAAARLGQVADQQAVPAILRLGLDGQPLDQGDQSGWPQLRLRDRRMTCQAGPSTASALPPARQPLA